METGNNFVRQIDKDSGEEFLRIKRQQSKASLRRKWYFACVIDSATNTTYIADAVFAPYLDRVTKELPSAYNFMLAMRSLVSRINRASVNAQQLKIPFKESRIRLSEKRLRKIIAESIRKVLYN